MSGHLVSNKGFHHITVIMVHNSNFFFLPTTGSFLRLYKVNANFIHIFCSLVLLQSHPVCTIFFRWFFFQCFINIFLKTCMHVKRVMPWFHFGIFVKKNELLTASLFFFLNTKSKLGQHCLFNSWPYMNIPMRWSCIHWKRSNILVNI